MTTHDPLPDDIQRRLDLAIRAARAAGELTLQYFGRRGLQVDRKSDASPVTVADRSAEQILREQIAAEFPDDAILGEEFPPREGTSGFRWILDPIDGTKSFISGVPLYATLVGIECEGKPTIGVIEIPALGERAWAAIGGGAWHETREAPPQKAAVSTRDRLADGVFVVSEVANFAARGRGDAFERLQAAAGITRTWGDGYGYLLVATGRAEVMVDPIMNVWDAAAILPVVAEAGGTFTDWQSKPTIHSGEGVATNGRVFAEVMGLLESGKPDRGN
jgi:histidinol phosphatase-like enzyme (inositol monophosphatase family)